VLGNTGIIPVFIHSFGASFAAAFSSMLELTLVACQIRLEGAS
jgi:hypothetical protein